MIDANEAQFVANIVIAVVFGAIALPACKGKSDEEIQRIIDHGEYGK